MPVNRYAYLLLFLVPALLPAAFLLGRWTGLENLFAFFPILVLQGLLPLIDWFIGNNARNLSEDSEARVQADGFYRLLTLAVLPVQLAVLIWAAWVACGLGTFDWPGFIGWIISTGYVGGILAINVGHELIHKRSRLEQWTGGVLLSTVCYGTFKVEHVRGHHVHVATPEDPSSAGYDQSLYSFLLQAIPRNVSNAWRLEHRRLRQLGLPWWHWRNELLWWSALSLAWLGLATTAFGWLGAVFFVGQSLEAILSLETVNYVEHYGLRRRRLENGRYERPNPTHSWNSDAILTNLILLQLARHSDHHANATRPYPALRHFDESPQLPAGYSTMFLLAWVPPLWRRVMNPRVRAYQA
ncbi:MAG: alkane 1-monooxygenase [Xanthomonadales bacterium]|nr:alkane 1-monooxygenase [Xanthomonadales bacterium]